MIPVTVEAGGCRSYGYANSTIIHFHDGNALFSISFVLLLLLLHLFFFSVYFTSRILFLIVYLDRFIPSLVLLLLSLGNERS